MQELMKFNEHANGPFGQYPLEETFWRSDFQYRGSPHVHMMGWCKGAPIYESIVENSDDEDDEDVQKNEYSTNYNKCVVFIDKYITCERPSKGLVRDDDLSNTNDEEEDDQNEDETQDQQEEFEKDEIRKKYAKIEFQLHSHKDNCKYTKNSEELCKYGFPWPILEETNT
jgi:hypothetical protein